MAKVSAAQLDTLQTDSLTAPSDSVEPGFQIIPWEYNRGVDDRTVSGDSLMRWQIWPDWTFKRNRDPGVITFRLGTVGRSSALMVDAHEPRHQSLYWEDIELSDPASGLVNWNIIPIHKVKSIYEDSEGIEHRTGFTMKHYYTNKPLTKLLFEESKFSRRSLEFWATRNFSQKTNLELSFWDRRAGGGYPRSNYTGRQIFGRLYHQLDNRQFLKLRYLNGKRDLEQPFGYQITDLATYSFDRFTATALQPNASSSTTNSILALSYHRRESDTTAVPENLRATLYRNNYKRELTFSDTTFYHVKTTGAAVHKWLDLNFIQLEGKAGYEINSNEDQEVSTLDQDGWNLLSTELNGKLVLLNRIELKGGGSYKNRSDGFDSKIVKAGAGAELLGLVEISAGASSGNLMPTPQQLYWNANVIKGDKTLVGEEIDELHGRFQLNLFGSLGLGVKGQVKQVDNGIFISGNNSFANVNSYSSLSATAYFDYGSDHVELSGSATMHRYRDFEPGPLGLVPDFRTERIWMKGGAYVKGYVLNRAAYVKFGVSGMFAPQSYLADDYRPEANYWQPSSNDQLIPGFSRMDIDLSARVRSIMFVVRYENVLDEVNQLGYFETANYPMPPRRFIFGVRALFNN